ncbi:MAG: hypothetical protein DI628_04550 [Blastochloris viridis]|uniref:Peptidase M48 domain-containing protein n=1 Tax=Blastochloris viridis TaxID=1079 RepID=A0A6N4RD08_BLAVI|nr:MAG: hypothetical protein DI628_04550 [Blastochloris viridis]
MKRLPLVLLSSLVALSGRAANPATGGRTFSLVSAKEERAIGESAAESVLKTYGLYKPEGRTARYVVDICQKIYAQTETASDPITCNFVDDGTFNASATPGYMIINRGLLPYMSSEAELAAVLGHEAGHLTGRHINQHATHARMASIGMLVLAGVVASQSDSPAATNAALAVGGTGAALGMAAYSRAHETEADALGRRYMERLGYDPRESVRMVRGMEMYGNYQDQVSRALNPANNNVPGLLSRLQSSHPATPERIAAAVKATGEPVPAVPDNDTAGRTRFMDAIQGLAFGPSIKYGVERRGELVLPRQRVVVPLPESVVTVHTPPAREGEMGNWIIGHPQSGTRMTVSAVKLTQGRSPASLLKEVLPMLNDGVQQMPVWAHGTAAYAHTATFRYMNSSKRFRIIALPAAHPVNEVLMFMISYPDEATQAREDAGLMTILKGMDYVSEERAKRYQPQVIYTFRAAAGDTVANRASKMPMNALREELFRALNSLQPGEEMVPGQWYKTIVDPNS